MMHWLDTLGSFVNKVLLWIAGCALLGLLLFAVADMGLRAVGLPVAGAYEVIGWLSAAAMALALGPVQQQRGHVAVSLLEERFGPRLKATVELVVYLMSLVLFIAVAWYVARYALVLHATGSLSETLRVVVYPWVYVVAAGCAGLALSLFIDVVRTVLKLARSHVTTG